MRITPRSETIYNHLANDYGVGIRLDGSRIGLVRKRGGFSFQRQARFPPISQTVSAKSVCTAYSLLTLLAAYQSNSLASQSITSRFHQCAFCLRTVFLGTFLARLSQLNGLFDYFRGDEPRVL